VKKIRGAYMKRLFILLIVLFFLSCSTKIEMKSKGASPTLLKENPKFKDHDEWYFSSKIKILSDELTAKLTPILPAKFKGEVIEEERCKDVQVTDPNQDLNSRDYMQNEVSISVSGNNIVVTYNDGNESNKSISGYSYSMDGGKSFTDGGSIIPQGGMYGGGDPLILSNPFDPNHFIYFQLTYGGTVYSSIVAHESFDGGKTFLPENSRSILKGLLSPFNGLPLEKRNMFHDKEWGGWSPSNGIITIAWTLFADTNRDGYDDEVVPVAITSKDNGKTWSNAQSLIPEGWWGGLCAVGSGLEGEIYVVYDEFVFNQLYLMRSFDGGTTWDGPYLVAPSFQNPFNRDATNQCDGWTALKGQIRVASIPSLAVDPKNGNLYVVYHYKESKNSKDDSDIAFVMSEDKGVTWTNPIKINDDNTLNDQFMPWVASAGGGNVLVMFYDRREDPENWLINVYVAQSLDGGKTWLKNRKVSCTPFPPASSNCYMGDYNQVVSDGSYYYLAWGDNRNTIKIGGEDKPNQDVFSIKLKALPHIRPF